MQLYQIKSPYWRKNKKRIGRGGKRGTYSGKGQKGQKARAGRRIKPAERLLIAKFPKFRGVKNKSIKEKSIVINVSKLSLYARDGMIDKKILCRAGVIKRMNQPVKILGDGMCAAVFIVRGISCSKSAREKIEKAGGKIL